MSYDRTSKQINRDYYFVYIWMRKVLLLNVIQFVYCIHDTSEVATHYTLSTRAYTGGEKGAVPPLDL